MAIQLTDEQLQALPEGLPVEMTAADGNVFYLLSADQYGKVRALFDDELDPRAMYPHMAKSFGATGWDDQEMDVYDTLDPRRQS